jgi:hypothetical protein
MTLAFFRQVVAVLCLGVAGVNLGMAILVLIHASSFDRRTALLLYAQTVLFAVAAGVCLL